MNKDWKFIGLFFCIILHGVEWVLSIAVALNTTCIFILLQFRDITWLLESTAIWLKTHSLTSLLSTTFPVFSISINDNSPNSVSSYSQIFEFVFLHPYISISLTCSLFLRSICLLLNSILCLLHWFPSCPFCLLLPKLFLHWIDQYISLNYSKPFVGLYFLRFEMV